MKAYAVAMLGWVLVPFLALAQGKVALNTITSVRVEGGTVVITGTQKPNFTTFTMTDPPRLVVDISEAVLKGVPDEIPVTNGLVTGLRTANYGSDASAIARVLIGYERDVETDIQVSDNVLVVKVLEGDGPAVAQAPRFMESPTTPTGPETPAAEAPPTGDAQGTSPAPRQPVAEASPTLTPQERAAQEKRAAAEAAKQAEEERRAQAQAAAEEKKRLAEAAQAEAEARRLAEAEEKKRRAEEAEAKRLAEAEERKRRTEEARAAAEAKRLAEAEEKKRRAEEAEARRLAEAEEKKRRAEEARAARVASAAPLPRESVRDSAGAEPATSGRRKTLELVGFQQLAATSRVYVRTNEPAEYKVSQSDKEIILELENTQIGKGNNTRALDTSFFDTAVSRVDPTPGPDRSVRVSIKLKGAVPVQTRREGNTISLEFPRPSRQ